MQKMLVAVLLLLICPAIITASAAEDDAIASSKIGEVATFDDVLIEC